MSVQFQNYDFKYKKDNKWIFVPNSENILIGNSLIKKINSSVNFPSYYYHLNSGGHVSGLHAHRENLHFCKIDLRNFFYSIRRNRVVRTLRKAGISGAANYGRWSCVKNPYSISGFALPYGFVQSPILASLVLMHSNIGKLLDMLASRLTIVVYVDDISMSADNIVELRDSYQQILGAVKSSEFQVNQAKCQQPSMINTIFNCDIYQGHTNVTSGRVTKFQLSNPCKNGIDAFNNYCTKVAHGNIV